MKTAIAYTRESTAQQGKSGLGLEAQLAALERFAKAEGYNFVQSFEEVETGKGVDALDRRPQLSAALKAAKRSSWQSWALMRIRSCCTCMPLWLRRRAG
jgi:DNA invertase Pin-like site-specific DNA recombinase